MVSFIIHLSFKQTLPVSLISRKNRTCLSLFKYFSHTLSINKPNKVCTLLKIKIHILLITQERVEILQKFVNNWMENDVALLKKQTI